MADTVSKKNRSEIMSRIKNKDSEIEKTFRKELWKKGLRYRKNSPKYFGKPDLVFKRYKTIIFLDSCFWHGCKQHCRIPNTRKKYWKGKITGNMSRDEDVNEYYKKTGWKLIRFWEHDLKKNFKQIIDKTELKFKAFAIL